MNFTTTPLAVTPEGTRYMGATNEYGIPLGQLAITRDGRRFRFVSVATDLTFENAPVGPPAASYRLDALTPTWTPTQPFQHGRRKYTLTASILPTPTTARPANFYDLIAFTFQGVTHALAHHSAIVDGVSTCEIEFAADDGIYPNEPTSPIRFVGPRLYRGLQAATDAIVGVAVMPLSPAYPYGWAQVGGPLVLGVDGAATILSGAAVTGATFTAAVRLAAAGEQIIGVTLAVSSPGEQVAIDLRLS